MTKKCGKGKRGVQKTQRNEKLGEMQVFTKRPVKQWVKKNLLYLYGLTIGRLTGVTRVWGEDWSRVKGGILVEEKLFPELHLEKLWGRVRSQNECSQKKKKKNSKVLYGVSKRVKKMVSLDIADPFEGSRNSRGGESGSAIPNVQTLRYSRPR